ncbi:MAG: universal stress protein, partial [Chlamydiae bacterium]|nr:universal stress protein [Chlamydiota bacterium]
MKLLVAIDGSKASQAAVKYAARLFKSFIGENHISLITVQDDSSLRLFKKRTPKGAVEDYLRENADK